MSRNLPDDLAYVEARYPGVAPVEHYGFKGDLLFTSFEILALRP